MTKRTLDESQAARKAHHETDSERRSAKKRRKVSGPDEGLAIESPEELRKKERKERKRLKKLEGTEHHQADKAVLGADGEERNPVTGLSNGAIKAARKGKETKMMAEGQSSHKTTEHFVNLNFSRMS